MACKALFLNFFFISFLFGLAVGQWSNFGGNAQRQSRSNATGDPLSNYSWTLDGTDYTSSPVIGSDGTLYIRLTNGSTCALNSANGQFKWVSANLGFAQDSGVALASDEKTLFVANYTSMFALKTDNGNILWNFTTGAHIQSTPVTGPDGTVYFGSNDQYLYAISGSTGSLKWSFPTQGIIRGSPALGLNGRVLLIGGDGWMYSIYSNNGSLDWKYNTGSSNTVHIGNPAVSDDGTIFAADQNGLFAFAPNGTVLWSNGSSFDASPAISWNGYIYIISINTVAFWCIHPNGTILWYHPTAAIFSTATVGYDDSVYIGLTPGLFYCLDGNNGSVKWSINISSIASAAAIGPDGSVYIVNYSGTLYAFLTNRNVQIDNDVNIGLNDLTFSNLTLTKNASLTIEVSNGKSGTITITGCGNLAGTLILNVTDIDRSESITLFQYPFHSTSHFALALQCWR
jgi:outer membrane protein assembly factor BamB